MADHAAIVLGVIVPLLAYGVLCWRLRDFDRRSLVISVGAGVVAVGCVMAAASAMMRLIPVSARESPVLAAFTYAAGLEEAIKLLALLAVMRVAQLRSVRDFLPVATGLACGFAAAENLLVLERVREPMSVLAVRLTVAFPAHVGYAAVVAAVLSWGGMPVRGRFVAAALVVAVLWHGMFDALTFSGFERAPAACSTVLGLFAVLAWWRHLRRPVGV